MWPIHSVTVEVDSPTPCPDKPKKQAKHPAMQVALKRNKKPRKKQPAKMKQEKKNGKA